jgi:hypothetical protein
VPEQQFEWSLEKRGVHRLENTIILVVRLNPFDESFPGALSAQAASQQFAGV